MKFAQQTNEVKLGIGGVMLAGSGIASVNPNLNLLAVLLFIIGFFMTFLGFFRIVAPLGKLYPIWDESVVRNALDNLPQNGEIAILQTWFPDAEKFFSHLTKLVLDQDKSLILRIYLMDYREGENTEGDILTARVSLRDEVREDAVHNIESNIRKFQILKQKAISNWKKNWIEGAPEHEPIINLNLYRFMPFGPIYKIGNTMFIGFYLNYDSSTNAPMIMITETSPLWGIFTKQLLIAEQNSIPV